MNVHSITGDNSIAPHCRKERAFRSLRTIDPHDKGQNDGSLKLAQSWIAESRVVYILGYGFDDANSERIGLARVRTSAVEPKVMFTNCGDNGTVNKRASRLFCGMPNALGNEKILGDPSGRGLYIEKSTRNAYDALAQDFDALEE